MLDEPKQDLEGVYFPKGLIEKMDSKNENSGACALTRAGRLTQVSLQKPLSSLSLDEEW